MFTTLLATACTAPSGGDRADDLASDSVTLDSTTPPAPAPVPDPTADADGVPVPAADSPGIPAEQQTDEPAEEPGARAGDVGASIPARFHGEWNADLAACGTGASETRLRISADRVRFYESAGTVRGVEVVSRRVIDVTAEYRGEGDTWRDERRFTLSEDGNSLTVSNGGNLVRYRCP